MIEVLIALLISMFALLGLAGLQINSMRYQKTANFRAQATQYASEMSDRIRANLAGARAGSYNFASESYSTSAPTAPPSNPCNGSNRVGCTAAMAATQDLYAWRVSLNQGMSGGWGEVSGDVRSGFVIRVYFKEPDNQSTTADRNCRGGALGTGDKDVRCFVTVFIP
jgi:type IV pilus assembly protein PilV